MLIELKAPCPGVFTPIEKCPDPVFAARTLGEGISIDPTDRYLLAPCKGTVIQLHRALHALTLRTANQVEILLHIGINTVTLNGQGFKPLVQMGDTVDVGQRLIEFDMDLVATKATSLITQMIVLNSTGATGFSTPLRSGQLVSSGDVVASFQVADAEVNAPAPAEVIVKEKSEGSFAKLNSKPLEIINQHGLHARPIAVLTAAAKNFSSNILVHLGSQGVNAKSVTALLSLDVKYKDVVRLTAQGKDAEQAIRTLGQLIVNGLGEAPAPIAPPIGQQSTAKEPREVEVKDDARVTGVCASPGIAIGEVFQIRHPEISVNENGGDPRVEKNSLHKALAEAGEELNRLQQTLSQKTGAAKAAIFAAHEEILQDPDIISAVENEIAKGKSAAFSWKKTMQLKAEALGRSKNEMLAARASDLRDVAYRVLRIVSGAASKASVPLVFPDNVILIAEDLTPSDTATLDTSKVRGFCTIAGGATSHVAILARALGIPALAAITPRALNIPNGTPVLLNGERGFLQENPKTEELVLFRNLQAEQDSQRQQAIEQALEKAQTLDGTRIEVAANIGNIGEAEKCVPLGADGVGLLRSEFLFLDRQEAPSEEEQFRIYKKIAKTLGDDKSLIVRTLDVGGDKPLPYLPIPAEENPFLGERGIRVGLKNPEILNTQLRAILRASEFGKLMIMFPMISSLKEFETARLMVLDAAQDLGVRMIPVGIMVEVPAAALLAEQFASVVDFFSIGTNDLAQYTLAMDRGNSRLADRLDGLDPSILRLIDMTVQAGKRYKKWTGVCGGLASETAAIPLLIGLGVSELSVSVPALPMVKAQVRGLDRERCEKLAQTALNLTSASEVRQLVENAFTKGTHRGS